MADLTPDPTVPLDELLAEATRRLIRTADRLADGDYPAASALPDWTRGHVLAHLALNAEGLAGALGGIVEGRTVPMYASQESRDADIDELAGEAPAAIRARLLGACTDFADAITAVPDDAWDTTIERTTGGRTFPAADVPRMRLREVEIHHADLAAGYDRSGWPPVFATLLLDGVTARVATGLTAYATDLDRTWVYGDADARPTVSGPTVSGTAADLGWWLTGRGNGEGLTSDRGELPQMEEW